MSEEATDDIARRLELAEVRLERAKAVMDSLAGFCHALGQPAQVLLSSIELLRLPDADKDLQKQVLDICYEAVTEIRALLAQMKEKREYVSQAYLTDNPQAGSMIALPEWNTKRPARDRD